MMIVSFIVHDTFYVCTGALRGCPPHGGSGVLFDCGDVFRHDATRRTIAAQGASPYPKGINSLDM